LPFPTRRSSDLVVVHQHHVRGGAVGFAGGQQVRHHILVLVRLGVAGDELDAGNPFRLIADNPYFAVWQVPGDGAEGVAELLVGVAGAEKVDDVEAHITQITTTYGVDQPAPAPPAATS